MFCQKFLFNRLQELKTYSDATADVEKRQQARAALMETRDGSMIDLWMKTKGMAACVESMDKELQDCLTHGGRGDQHASIPYGIYVVDACT
jgi:hypothetical protein